MYCYIMQHGFGKPCNRTTLWRRAKAAAKILPLPDKNGKDKGRLKRGRAFSNDRETESFLLFSGAVIDLQNTRGEVFYSEIFIGEKQGAAGFVYHKVPKSLFDRLVESNFPPQLMAVVVSDLIPLAKITDRRRRLFVNLDSRKNETDGENENSRIERRIKQNEYRNEKASKFFAGAAGKDFIPLHKLKNEVAADGDGIDWEDMEERLARVGWSEPNIPPAPAPLRFMPIKPVKGTRVQRIDFRGGLEISRRMACYWRNDCRREYNRCRDFVKGLIKTRTPLRPNYGFENLAANDKSITKRFSDLLNDKSFTARQRARLTEKNKDKVRIERQPNYKDRFGD